MMDILYNGLRKVAGYAASMFNGDEAAVQPGSTYDHIRGVLGEAEYEELRRDSGLVLEAILYCQTEVAWVGRSLLASRRVLVPNFDENQQKKRLINHDSLMLKLRPGAQRKPAIYILAEKVGSGNDGSKAGIHITLVPKGAKEFERKCCLWRIECGSKIGLLELTAILKKKSPHYDVRHDHCWHYAAKTTEFLLQACIERKRNGSDDQRRLQKELKDLKANLVKQHVVNTLERVENFVDTNF